MLARTKRQPVPIADPTLDSLVGWVLLKVIARCGPDHQVEGAVGEQGVIIAQGPSVFGHPDHETPTAYLGIPMSEIGQTTPRGQSAG
eukprot:2570131-Amphidinium_carterae.1